MPDEMMTSFLEKIIDITDQVSEACEFLLQYYHVALTEKEIEQQMKNERKGKHGR